MTDEEINRKFDIVAGHLANLAVNQEKSEARISRLERVLKLAIRAGLRERRETRERINMLIKAQERNEERFAALQERAATLQERNEERFASLQQRNEENLAALQQRNEEDLTALQQRNEEDLAILQKRTEERFAALAESQANTDHKLNALIDIVREGRNGKAQ